MFPDTSSSSSSSSSDEEQEMCLRRPKIYRRREQHFSSLDDIEFFDRFRLTKRSVLCLLQQIASSLSFPSNRGGCIEPMQQLLLTLRFYATGNMLITAGDFIGVSKASASRIVQRVSQSIALLRPKYIEMCEGDIEMQAEAEKFYKIARFPKTIGAIGCTLIKIKSPGGDDAETFRCRKDFFAMKVQTVSDSELRIRDIVARWPGSAHNQTVFDNSNLKRKFQSGKFGPYLLVGDSSYTLEPYLMTKLVDARTDSEKLYNESIIKTRNVVERKNGVWKHRFPILSSGIRVKLETTLAIIVAIGVLHNVALDMSDIFPEEWSSEIQEDEESLCQHISSSASQTRQLIINEHFDNI